MPEPTVVQGIILVGFGAGIGCMTTYIAARTQAGFQRKQLLFDKKLSALGDLSKVIVRGADVLRQIRLFERAFHSANDESSRASATKRLIELEDIQCQWVAEIGTHVTLLQALFGDAEFVPPPNLINGPDQVLPTPAAENFEAWVNAQIDRLTEGICGMMTQMHIHVSMRAKQLNHHGHI
jgi:hypothetical protein